MKLKKNLATNSEGLIFDPSTGNSYSGNGIASFIIAAAKNGADELLVKEQILATYDVDPVRLERDWQDWLRQLEEANLLEL